MQSLQAAFEKEFAKVRVVPARRGCITHTCTQTNAHTHIRRHTCTHTAHIHTRMHACTYTHKHAHVHTHLHTHSYLLCPILHLHCALVQHHPCQICKKLCICPYMCVCVCVCEQTTLSADFNT
jgi:hypothetical protein